MTKSDLINNLKIRRVALLGELQELDLTLELLARAIPRRCAVVHQTHVCTLAEGHAGDHEAHVRENPRRVTGPLHVAASWPQVPA